MKKTSSKHRLLIFGASGFLGNAIYKELCSYFKTFGTYYTPNNELEKNKHFYHYNVEEDDAVEIIEAVKPTIIISALRGDFSSQIIAHKHMAAYVKSHKCKIIFLSSANVFDAYSKFPSYESDTVLSNSIYGHFKIKIETILSQLPVKKVAILRLPMVFGSQSPRIRAIKYALTNKEPIEIFPNLIMNVTTDSRVTQQVHYIVNRNKYGVFHLGSKDLVHHDDFIGEIIESLGNHQPNFKLVFTTNDDRYLAVLPKDNMLPKHLQLLSKEVIDELNLN
ncbi:MAG: sugar nucleotide-binding protein [Bacteroidia bacterium]|nr:sugar nucleotide-binding protein [Bacteroidia bacterium]MBT8278708.1 sugar nucleotide-binding protein [Bacteroidia bacterium]NND25561.1 sugar nucleotide-binding protein [Flavobacteriaceae bacterium]NNK60541.1 sugar nucleotide-binding protein [Flavobacteriaceae bacterium]NNL31613.1 sugar nucleotide-binding protein [Flavobacteriaceae bacterium]